MTDYSNVDQIIYLIENCLLKATYRPHSGDVGEIDRPIMISLFVAGVRTFRWDRSRVQFGIFLNDASRQSNCF